LKDIDAAHKVNAKSFPRKDLFYLQLVYHNKKHLLATNNDETANKWIQYLLEGHYYADYMDKKMKEHLSETRQESVLLGTLLSNPTEEIEIQDLPVG
jgi:hypothetical protein